jgi:hypothetical protein
MNKRLSTVTITTKNGPLVINEADYDPDTHTLADADPDTPAKPTPVVEPVVVPGDVQAAKGVAPEYKVQQDGNKHFVYLNDERVSGVKGIAAKGYATGGDAWAAIMALNTSD